MTIPHTLEEEAAMSAQIRNIVVGVATIDDQDPAVGPRDVDPVLAPAAALARRLGATLHVVHAYSLPDPLLTAYMSYSTHLPPEQRERYADEMAARLRELVEPLGEGLRVVVHAVEGSGGRVLCRLAESLDAELMVVGATRRGRLWRSLLGTTAESVLRGSHVPVLVVRRPAPYPMRRVLFATDLSPAGAAVQGRGAAVVEALCGGETPEMRALTVVWYDAMIAPPLREELLEAAAREGLERFLHEHGAPPMEPRIRTGDPSREIVNEASEWGADLLVLGTHGRSGPTRFLVGSTAVATLRGAGCNVLVVPAGGAPVNGDERAEEEALTAV